VHDPPQRIITTGLVSSAAPAGNPADGISAGSTTIGAPARLADAIGGRKPAMPQHDAGVQIKPLVSESVAAGER